MVSTSSYNTAIFDIGDVLFTWSFPTKTNILPNVLSKIISSPTWFDYERGRLGEDECYERIAAEFFVDSSDVRSTFQQARDSLQSDEGMISLIRELKEGSNGTLRVFAMSNISRADYEVLCTKFADWSIFDRVFTSCGAGERKPNLGFYRHVLTETGSDPYKTIFVDDKPENVLSARSLGIYGIVFDDPQRVRRALRNAFGDPLSRGRQFLQENAGHLTSTTDSGVVLSENFAQLLILEVTDNCELVNLVDHPRTWNFFQGKGQLTTEEFPFDLDTTSLGLTVMKRPKDLAFSVMDEMLGYVDVDGIIQTYFDHTRPRFDPVVCINALTLFYTHGRGHELRRTLAWVHEVLLNRAYLDGTRYYENAECFLFFMTRLLQSSGDADLHILKPLLKERVQELIGTAGDALQLSMRVIVCHFVGLRDDVDFKSLLPLQCEDGGWEIGWIYKYGSSKTKIGNRGLTTALALRAVELMASSTTPSSPTLLAFGAMEESTPSLPRRKHHRRNSSLRNSLQWLLHATRLAKSGEVR